MADEKRISVSFGAFAVEIEGYDDPFSVLSTVISHMKAASDAPLGERAFGAADLENADLLASLSQDAARLELQEGAEAPRLRIRAEAPENEQIAKVAEEPVPTPAAHPAQASQPAPEPAAEPAPDASLSQPHEDDAPLNTDPAPELTTSETQSTEAQRPLAAEKTTPAESADAPEVAEPEHTRAAHAETPPAQEEAAAVTDEETRILRRVSHAISHANDPVGDAPSTTSSEAPKAKPKPDNARTPAQQKADVVKDIATTLRRIDGRGEEPEAPKDLKPEARKIHKGELKPAPRKPLKMQMQIRPKKQAPAQAGQKPAKADVAQKPAAEAAAPVPKQPAKAEAPAIEQPTPKPASEAHAAAEPSTQALDKEKIRERLAKLAQNDEMMDNFLFDDVGPTVSVEAVSPEPAPQKPTIKPVDVPPADANAHDTEEPLLLTPAEAAPLILDNPVQEPLVLSNPVQIEKPAAEKVSVESVTAETEAAETVAVEPTQHATPGTREKDASPEATDTPPADADATTKKSETGAGFARLTETLAAEIPVLVEKGTRPKRRNGGPRLVAISDETQFDKSMSPEDFASHIGATSLHDLLEATAVYMAIVEGRAHFSRADVMHAFARIEISGKYTTEQRLKTFRKLLASGAITRVDETAYTLSHETRFGYETQLRA